MKCSPIIVTRKKGSKVNKVDFFNWLITVSMLFHKPKDFLKNRYSL